MFDKVADQITQQSGYIVGKMPTVPDDYYSKGAVCYDLIKAKVAKMADTLVHEHGLSILVAVEQELKTTEKHVIDVDACKDRMLINAQLQIKSGLETERARAQNILDALPHATTAEHLFNIVVYDRMHAELEFRGSPAIHGEGYYDMPGNIEFRTTPQTTPQEIIRIYEKLIDTIRTQAEEFGLNVIWRGEQLNISVWRGGQNITSVATNSDKVLAGRILMGILDTNEDVRPLIPRQQSHGKVINGGPTRLDIIRIVNQSADPAYHRFEQRDDFGYAFQLNVPAHLLILLDGILRSVDTATYDDFITPIRATWLIPKNRNAISDLRLDQTFRVLNRLEIDENGYATNVDALFAKPDILFWFIPGRIGEKVAVELTNEIDPVSEAEIAAYFKTIQFTESGIRFPKDSLKFKIISDRLEAMEFSEIKTFDSLKYSGVLVPDEDAAQKRVAALQERWGVSIVEGLSTFLLKGETLTGTPKPPIFRADVVFGGLGI